MQRSAPFNFIKMEKEERVSLHLQISTKLKKQLKVVAATTDRLIKDIVIEAIIAYLKTQKNGGSSKKTG